MYGQERLNWPGVERAGVRESLPRKCRRTGRMGGLALGQGSGEGSGEVLQMEGPRYAEHMLERNMGIPRTDRRSEWAVGQEQGRAWGRMTWRESRASLGQDSYPLSTQRSLAKVLSKAGMQSELLLQGIMLASVQKAD